jgi:hypothetical protein
MLQQAVLFIEYLKKGATLLRWAKNRSQVFQRLVDNKGRRKFTMNSKILLVTLSLVSIACGTAEKAPAVAPTTTPVAAVVSDTTSDNDLLSVAEEVKLPACDAKSESKIAYVRSLKSFKECVNGSWLSVELNQPETSIVKQQPLLQADNGKDGKDGANGKDGMNGANGKDGLNGAQGVAGINGTNGTTTIVNQSIPTSKLRDVNGVVIGDSFSIDQWNDYLVTTNVTGIRLRLSSTGGTLSSYKMIYASFDCTGPELIQVQTKMWETLYATDSGLRVKTGAPVTITSQSEKFPGNVCSAFTRTGAKGFASRAATPAEAATIWNYGSVYLD